MGLISPILRQANDGLLIFWCPGCDGAHGIPVGPGEGHRWTYNGNPHAPTFKPSIVVTYKRWNEAEQAYTLVVGVCHSFVTDGKIQFLNDCTHHLAGQTVAIPAWDD